MTAQGLAFQVGPTTVADDDYLTIQPSGSDEVIVHGVYPGGAAELYWYDGAKETLIDTIDGINFKSFEGRVFHLTNGVYLRCKNKSGDDLDMVADGIYSKPA